MYILLWMIHVIVCLFLIIVVLLQSGKAADLAGAFGGMGSQTAFGPRGSARSRWTHPSLRGCAGIIGCLGGHRFEPESFAKCEVAHTSPPIPRSKVRYSNFDLHGQETSMRRAVICVTAGLAAVAIGFGLNSATSQSTTEISISNPTPTPAISIWEIHDQVHLEFLPVQHIED